MNTPRVTRNTARLPARLTDISAAQGIALAAVLLLLLIITLIGTVSLRMSKEQQTMSLNLKQLTRAQFAAEQGVREAIERQIWLDDLDPTSTTWRIKGTGSGTDYNFTYTVEHRIALGAVAVNEDGFPYYVIKSEGVSGKGRRQLEVAVVRLYNSYSLVEDAFIGCRGVPFNSNGTIASYNSDGQFTPGDNANIKTLEANADVLINSNMIVQGWVRATGNITVDSNAEIMQDAWANGNIGVATNSTIHGDANAGGTITVDGSSTIDGNTESGLSPAPVPVQDCDPLDIDNYILTETAGISAPNPDGVATTFNAGADMTLNPGDYYFDSFNVQSNNVVTLSPGDHVWYVNGPLELQSNTGIAFPPKDPSTGEPTATLKIYITGQLTTNSLSFFGAENMTGDVTNSVSKPSALQIYSSAENTTDAGNDNLAMINLQSNTGFSGIIYAPKAKVVFNSNNDSYGAVRGRWAHLDSNADFYYDETLTAEETFNHTLDLGYKIVYWTEQNYDSYNTLNTVTSTFATTSSTSSTTTSATTTTTTSTSTTTVDGPTTTTAATSSTTTVAHAFEYVDAACSGRDFSFTLNKTAGGQCRLARIEFTSWPYNGRNKNGELEEVRIESTDVATVPEGEGIPPTFIGSALDTVGWIDPAASVFLFESGDSKDFRFRFADEAGNGAYALTLRFTPTGCGSVAVTNRCQ